MTSYASCAHPQVLLMIRPSKNDEQSADLKSQTRRRLPNEIGREFLAEIGVLTQTLNQSEA